MPRLNCFVSVGQCFVSRLLGFVVSVSIIIPTRNSAGFLRRTLSSVSSVVPAEGCEIVVVDNGSVDETRQVFDAAVDASPRHQWRYFYDDMPGLLTGRHRGALEARGEILAYLDDDVLLADNWWHGLQDAFSRQEVVLVGGPSLPEYECEQPAWLGGMWGELEHGRHCGYLSLIDQGDEVRACHPGLVFGLNFSIRRQAWRECGGFHPDCIPKRLQRYQGDGESGLSLKIHEREMVALYHPEVGLRHLISQSRLTPQAFEGRGFYQGVCDSFTRIRATGNTDDRRPTHWKDWLRPGRDLFQRQILLRDSSARAIQTLYSRAHQAGYAWHQREVDRDHTLLDWVLRENYFDYRLPAAAEENAAVKLAPTTLSGKNEWYRL